MSLTERQPVDSQEIQISSTELLFFFFSVFLLGLEPGAHGQLPPYRPLPRAECNQQCFEEGTEPCNTSTCVPEKQGTTHTTGIGPAKGRMMGGSPGRIFLVSVTKGTEETEISCVLTGLLSHQATHLPKLAVLSQREQRSVCMEW